jgi:hypothetical protein
LIGKCIRFVPLCAKANGVGGCVETWNAKFKAVETFGFGGD